MAIYFTRFAWWLWTSKENEPMSSGSSSDLGFTLKEPENVKFPLVKGTNRPSSPRKVKRKRQTREESRMDREYDIVIVPSEGGCLSGSESDDSDWSVGWLEPHGQDFESDNESDHSFAVLVPCYRPGCKEVVQGSNNELLSAVKNLSTEFSAGKSKIYMEQWLSSLQNFDSPAYFEA